MDPIKVEMDIKPSVCRTCLSPNATTSLSEDCDEGSTLGAMLEKIADVRVKADLPSVICYTCAADLRSAIAFRRRAQLSDQTLRQKATSTNSNTTCDDTTLANIKCDDGDHTILLLSLDIRNRLEFIDEETFDNDSSSASNAEDNEPPAKKFPAKEPPAKKPFTLVSDKKIKSLVSKKRTNVSHSQSLQMRNNSHNIQTYSTSFTAEKSQNESSDRKVYTNVKKLNDLQNKTVVSNAAVCDIDSKISDYDKYILGSTEHFNPTKCVPYDQFESWSPPGSPRRVPSPPRRFTKPKPTKKLVERTVEETIEVIYDTSTFSIVVKQPPDQELIDTSRSQEDVIDLVEDSTEDVMNLDHPIENQSTQVIEIDYEQDDDSNDIFLCNVCNKAFENKLALDDHMKQHQHKCPYPECGITFETKQLRIAHIKNAHTRFMCLKCGEKFATKELVAKHMSSHKSIPTRETTTQCEIFNEYFESRKALCEHADQLNHHLCPYPKCGGTVVTKELVMGHVIYTCHKCGKKHGRKDIKSKKPEGIGERAVGLTSPQTSGKQKESHEALYEHAENHHVCPYQKCSGTVVTKELLMGHVIYTCHKCGKKHGRKDIQSKKPGGIRLPAVGLTSGQQKKSIIKDVQCQVCGELFLFKSSFSLHMRSKHTGERPFRCEECGKGFISNSRRKDHQRTHLPAENRPRPYTCDICSKSFEKKTRLKVHMQSHSEVRSFGCKQCGRKFGLKNNLVMHEKNVHGLYKITVPTIKYHS